MFLWTIPFYIGFVIGYPSMEPIYVSSLNNWILIYCVLLERTFYGYWFRHILLWLRRTALKVAWLFEKFTWHSVRGFCYRIFDTHKIVVLVSSNQKDICSTIDFMAESMHHTFQLSYRGVGDINCWVWHIIVMHDVVGITINNNIFWFDDNVLKCTVYPFSITIIKVLMYSFCGYRVVEYWCIWLFQKILDRLYGLFINGKMRSMVNAIIGNM